MNLKDKELIKKTFKEYVFLWNEHDIQSWGKLFTDNTDFITWSGTWFVSNQVNVQQHQKAHEQLKKQNMTYELDINNISFVNSTMAVVHATWEWSAFETPTGQEDRKGILTMLLIKEKGKWLIRTTQNTRIN